MSSVSGETCDSFDSLLPPVGSGDFLSLLVNLNKISRPSLPLNVMALSNDLLVHTSKGITQLDVSLDKCVLDLLIDDIDKQSWDQYIYDVAVFIKSRKGSSSKVELSTNEINAARDVVLGVCQRLSWIQLYGCFENFDKFKCPKNLCLDYKHLLKVSAFFDPVTSLIRCYGRHAGVNCIFVSDRSYVKTLLPDKNPISKKLILSIHVELQHIGPLGTTGFISRDYWLIRSIQYVANVLSACLPCKVQKAITTRPEMAVLPRVRLESFKMPFSNCGIDCAGPFKIKYSKAGRNFLRNTNILVFTCLNTRAVSFGILKDMSSDAFLVSLEIFNLRNQCSISNIYSDMGSSFWAVLTFCQWKSKKILSRLTLF